MKFRWELLAALAMSACGGQQISTGKPPAKQPPANAVGGFSAQLPPVTLMPGEESFPCVIFPIEWTGSSRTVGGATLNATPGMHHGNVSTRRSTGAGIRDCPAGDNGNTAFDILGGGAVLFASSTQVVGAEWQSFPAGMGYPVREGDEIVARMHYINASPKPLTVAPSYQWYTIPEASVVHRLAPFVWAYDSFSIPPMSDLTVTAKCDFTDETHLVNMLPHMHKLGKRMTAGFKDGTLDGKLFLDSPGYSPDTGVLLQYDPAITIDQRSAFGVTWSCTWHNTFDKTIVEGNGDNEMCMMFGYAWPLGFTAIAKEGSCFVGASGSK